MAKLGDVPVVLRSVGTLEFLKRVGKQISEDSLFTWAAALAYSWLFAVFPFFIFLMTLLPYLPVRYKHFATSRIENVISALPKESQQTVRPIVEQRLGQLLDGAPAGFRLIGILITIWAASGGVAATMAAMDRAYDVEKFRPIYKQRPIAMALTVACCLMIVAVIVLIPVGTMAARWLANHTGKVADWLAHWMGPVSIIPQFVKDHVEVIITIWQLVRFSLAFVLMFGLVSIIYHFGPNMRQKYRMFTPGAVFTIAVWMILGKAFRLYVDNFGQYNRTYGEIGGVTILLLFFYIDAVVLLIGAEINSELDFDILKVPRGTYDLKTAELALRSKNKRGPATTAPTPT